MKFALKTGWKYFIFIQLLNILFSFCGVLAKFASTQMVSYGFFSLQTLGLIAAYGAGLAIYAFFWQKVLSKVELSTAYLSKGTLLFWSLMWAYLLFGEDISLLNMLGTAIIFCGTVLVA